MELDRLVAEIDGHLGGAGVFAAGRGDRRPVVRLELDHQQPILKRVGLEDIGEPDPLPGAMTAR